MPPLLEKLPTSPEGDQHTVQRAICGKRLHFLKVLIAESCLAELILVLAELKPATDLTLAKWNESPESAEKKISGAGLVYKELDRNFSRNENLTCFLGVARQMADAIRVTELMLSGGGYEEFGHLMGYPQTTATRRRMPGNEKN